MHHVLLQIADLVGRIVAHSDFVVLVLVPEELGADELLLFQLDGLNLFLRLDFEFLHVDDIKSDDFELL